MLALWLKAKSYLIAIGAALALVLAIFLKGKSAGRESAAAKQREADDAARKRVEAVKPADSAGTVDKLRDGSF